ncbi:MAG: signal peptide peptidase SppA [Desulfuromonadia bacterium]
MRRWFLILTLILLFIVSAIFSLAAIMGLIDTESLSREQGVGVVEVKGPIIDSTDTVRELYEMQKLDRVKTIVLRIDSPGGIVGPSQEISDAVKKINARKKVIVSMGSVAASGGYYIAAPAHLIFANPGTITASIGVLMKFSNIEGLMGKIGMKAFTLKTGEFKDSGSPFKKMTPEERRMLQDVIDGTHRQFVAAVAEGRKIPVDQVAAIADGRIMNGEQALRHRLVDRLGTFRDAVAEAGRMAGLGDDPPLIHPTKKKPSLIDFLLEETRSGIGRISGSVGGYSLRFETDWN